MTQQTWEKIREWKNVKEEMNACKTRARKVELQKKYAEINRKVKKSARRNQRNWIDNPSYQAEEAANNLNSIQIQFNFIFVLGDHTQGHQTSLI
jgi:hypothetical protein